MNPLLQTLKTARRQKGLKQAELGRKLGLPQSHISTIENGATDPRLSTFTDMARLLGFEPVLVPIAQLPAVEAFIKGESLNQPRWTLDNEDE